MLILPSEALHPSCGIHQLLLPGKERMTGRTDLHPDILHRAASFDYITTGTGDGGLKILGMNLRFQLISSFSLPAFGGSALLPSTLLRDSERSRTVTTLSSTLYFVLRLSVEGRLRPEGSLSMGGIPNLIRRHN